MPFVEADEEPLLPGHRPYYGMYDDVSSDDAESRNAEAEGASTDRMTRIGGRHVTGWAREVVAVALTIASFVVIYAWPSSTEQASWRQMRGAKTMSFARGRPTTSQSAAAPKSTRRFTPTGGASAKPHILVVIADDVGIGDLFVAGETEGSIATGLDTLKREGVTFANFYSMHVCTPARSALLTGKYPLRTGMQHSVIQPTESWGLSTDEILLPQVLEAEGYFTALLGKWHVGHGAAEMTPLHRGFRHFFGYLTGAINRFTHDAWKTCTDLADDDKITSGTYYHDLQANGKPDPDDTTYMSDLVTDRALKIVSQHDSETPLFMMLAYSNVHQPISVPDDLLNDAQLESVNSTCRRTYLADIIGLDQSVSRVVEEFKDKGLWDNTVMVFFSDNGAETDAECGSNFPFRGRKGTLFEGGVRTPAFITSPLLPADVQNTTFQGLVHVTDIMPTVLEGVLRINLSSTPLDVSSLDGINQWSTIVDGDYPEDLESSVYPRQEVVINLDGFETRTDPTGAIRVGDWKLIINHESYGWWVPTGDDSYEEEVGSDGSDTSFLFNLRDDPYETINLYEQRSDVVELLLLLLMRYNATAYADPLCCTQDYTDAEIKGVWDEMGGNVVPWKDILDGR